jgi:hypothetical protein
MKHRSKAASIKGFGEVEPLFRCHRKHVNDRPVSPPYDEFDSIEVASLIFAPVSLLAIISQPFLVTR